METLRKDEKKALNDELKAIYNTDIFDKKDFVSIEEPFLKINNECRFFRYDGKWAPALRFVHSHPETIKKIAVDMGAVKFICGGADVMRPGIMEIDEGISAGEFVAIVDAKHKKALAIGVATLDSAGLQAATSGKIIKNIHYIGDKIWKMGEEE